MEQMRFASETGGSVPLVPSVAATMLRISSRAIFGIDIGINTDHAMTLMNMASISNRLAGIGVFDTGGSAPPAPPLAPALDMTLRRLLAPVVFLPTGS